MPSPSDRRRLLGALRAAYADMAHEYATRQQRRGVRGRSPQLPPGRLTEARYTVWAAAQPDAPSARELRRAFGGWAAAKRAAGLAACGPVVTPASAATARRDLRRAIAAHRRTTGTRHLGKREYAAWAAAHGGTSLHGVQAALGGWTAAIVSVGGLPGWQRRPTDGEGERELLDELRAVAAQLGRAPSVREYVHLRPLGAASRASFDRRWGSWNGALMAAGLTPTYGPRTRHQTRGRREPGPLR